MIIQCDCRECGTKFEEFDKWGRRRRFVNGHQNRGVNHPLFGKHQNEKTKQAVSKAHKGKPKSKEHRERISKSSMGHISPCGMKGKKHSPATKQLMSIASKDKPKSEAHRKALSTARIGKFCGENHPNWKGGISKEPYCQEWTPWLKEEIKERDNFQCKNPDCTNEITKNNPLCVHHIDYDKKNCSANNLVTICRCCNARANANRGYWEEFYNGSLLIR